MKIVVVSFVSAKESWHQDFIKQYTKKLQRFGKIERLDLKASKASEPVTRKNEEYEQIQKQLNDGDYLVLCDECGKTFSSRQVANLLEDWQNRSYKRIVICIGGAFGFHADLKERAQLMWSLSASTMNHLLAEMVLIEQLYRAHTILHNHPYHND